MDTANQQTKRIFPFPAWIIVGYFVLAAVFIATGQAAGFSVDAMTALVEHAAARSLELLCIGLFVVGTIGKSSVERLSRVGMNKLHLTAFLTSIASAAIGMLAMILHGPVFIKNFCFDVAPWWISWCMAYEYWFVVFHGTPDPD